MKDITEIPENKLLKDKDESYKDIINCEAVLKIGVKNYSGGSVLERLNVNKEIINKIDNELDRRKCQPAVKVGSS